MCDLLLCIMLHIRYDHLYFLHPQNGVTALHEAAAEGHTNVVKYLCENSANVAARDIVSVHAIIIKS